MNLNEPRLLPPLFLALLMAAAPLLAAAADTEPARPPTRAAAPAADPLAAARGHIQASQWEPAISELRKVGASGNADWNNLMGYALRKQAAPDLEAAQRHYDTALRIDPKHRGALEYAGELALIKGDLPTAEARLATLGQVCSSPCEPLDDLKTAVARYKSTGKP